MRWLAWAKVSGVWNYYGDYPMNEVGDRALSAIYGSTEEVQLCLYIPSLGNREMQ